MKESAKILALHPKLQTFFPNKPERWEFVESLDDIDQTIAHFGDSVDILLPASIEKLDREMLNHFPNLKMITSISAGFSNVDLEECRKRKIHVTNAPGLNSGDVADVAVSMMTSLLLNIPQNHDYILTD